MASIKWKVTQINGVAQRPSMWQERWPYQDIQPHSTDFHILFRAVLLPEVTLCTTPSLVLVPVKGNRWCISSTWQRTLWFLDMDGCLFLLGAVRSCGAASTSCWDTSPLWRWQKGPASFLSEVNEHLCVGSWKTSATNCLEMPRPEKSWVGKIVSEIFPKCKEQLSGRKCMLS